MILLVDVNVNRIIKIERLYQKVFYTIGIAFFIYISIDYQLIIVYNISNNI